MSTSTTSKYRAESHKDPHWITIRLIPADALTMSAPKEFMAWLVPPDTSHAMRLAMGSLAWGRFPWEDALALAIAHGLCASYYAQYEGSSYEREALSCVQTDPQDASKPPEYTKHSFDPIFGRASTNTPSIAWATVKINTPIDPHNPASNKLIAELDAIMKAAHPDCILIGPHRMPPRHGQLPHCGGSELVALIQEAQAHHEHRRLNAAISMGKISPPQTL